MLKNITLEELDKSRRANRLGVAVTTSICLVACVIALVIWMTEDEASVLAATARLPGTDGQPEWLGEVQEVVRVDLTGQFAMGDGTASTLPGTWASFRGPKFDNIITGGEPLNGSFGEEGPDVLWSLPVGEGYAAPAILNGIVYLMDYDEEKRADLLRTLSLEDGKEIWRRWYPNDIKRHHGMSRTIPAVTEKYIVTIGPSCHVVCVDTETGDFRWGIDQKADYGTVEPPWYTSQCPIIDNGIAVIAPCGDDVFMMGVSCETGEIVWQTPNTSGWGMAHSSIIPMTLLGKKMYVYCALGALAGVSAEGDDIGTLLWSQLYGANVVAPSPVQVEDDRIFMTAGYGKGNMMVQLSESNGEYSSEILYKLKPDEGLACEQQTPIYVNGYLYGIMPMDAGPLKGQFVCYTPEGELKWSSGSDRRYGWGPFILADDKFYLLSDDGTLTVATHREDKFEHLAESQILDGHDAWGPIAVAGTRMLMRDLHTMVCLDLSTKG